MMRMPVPIAGDSETKFMTTRASYCHDIVIDLDVNRCQSLSRPI